MEPIRIRDYTFDSRLFVGSGKYRDYDEMLACWEASGTEMVTVAVRRVDLKHEKELIYCALGRMKRLSRTDFQTVALYWLCAEYLSGAGLVPPTGLVPYRHGERTKVIRFFPHPDQAETIREAITTAMELAGALDETAALVEISVTFLVETGQP